MCKGERLGLKSKKWIATFLTLACLFSIFSLTVLANDTEITETANFTSEDTVPVYKGFDEEIIRDDKLYTLKNITYTKTDENKQTENEEKTTQVIKEGLNSKIYELDSSASYYHSKIEVDGKEYECTLIDVEYDNQTRTGRSAYVEGTEEYGLRTDKPNPPKTKVIQHYDSDTETMLDIEAPLIELKTTSTEWQDYTYIDITVNNYTDTQYMFYGNIVKHNNDTVLPSEHYGKLLEVAGFNNEGYRIEKVQWTNEPYKKGNVKYRQSRAYIQAYACSYTAYYYKQITLPDIPAYRATLTYKYADTNVIKTIYSYCATAHYELVDITEETSVATLDEPKKNDVKDEIPVVVKTITTISFLLVFSIIVVIVAMFLLTKVRKHKFGK